jgi:hypothetical protein
MRWWSGLDWTEHTKPAVAQAAPAFPVAPPAAPQQTAAAVPYRPADPRDSYMAPSSPSAMKLASQSDSIVQKNPSSFLAIGISATYLVIAVYTGIILFGIVPAYLSFKAFGNREKLAPLAIVAAGIAIAFSLSSLRTP